MAVVYSVREPGDPPPGRLVFGRVHPGAARRDPALRRNADHLGHHQRGTACRLAAEMDQVEVGRRAIAGRVHIHRRDDDPVLELQVAQPDRLEHRRNDLARAQPAPLAVGREPRVDARGELRITQPQVLVGDPAAPGDDVEGELLGVLVRVLTEVLEPFQAGLRGALGGLDDRAALGLVGGQGGIDVGLLVQARGERQRVLHRQLGARADGEVRGVRGVAEQHHVVGAASYGSATCRS